MNQRMRNGRLGLLFVIGRRLHLVQLPLLLLLGLALGGCGEEDCINCVGLPLPVVPTGVHSISGDNEVIVQWYDISYAPYDGSYNDTVAGYRIYSRFYTAGDEDDSTRVFYRIGEIAWNQNFDLSSGLHWFVDAGDDVFNGEQYEYAVAAVNAAGGESALSFELVTDAPLPISATPVELFDGSGPTSALAGFDFSELEQGRTDPFAPTTAADVYVAYSGGVPYLHAISPDVQIQDFGVFTDRVGNLVFEGVSWAPLGGYSATGVLEIVAGHIYVIKITESGVGTHYAKLGIVAVDPSPSVDSVLALWAYQLIEGLPELAAPIGGKPVDVEPVTLRL